MSLTREFCEELVALHQEPLSEEVSYEARRSMLNVCGTAIGASTQPAIDATIAIGKKYGGRPVASVPGRATRLDLLNSALTFGLAAHLDDFDDTHLETVIHPSAATLGSILPLGLQRRVSGANALSAFALGCEAQLRVGVAMSPWHYDEGWHITGTCGVLGAAIGAGLVAGLDGERLTQAVGIAASQTVGHREGFGSMVKSFHPGKAAANGLLAVLLVERGFTGSERVLEAPRGFFNVLSPKHDSERVNAKLGQDWELLRNTYKPYPCGIVSHPAIDAAVSLSSRIEALEDIERVVVHCHSLVPELTSNPDPLHGLQARFSTIHGVAAGLADGRVGLEQYADSRVREPDLIDLRAKTTLQVDDQCARDAATVELQMRDGSVLSEPVKHARGSLARPLTDEELRVKVEELVEPILPGITERLVSEVYGIAYAPGLEQLDTVLAGDDVEARD